MRHQALAKAIADAGLQFEYYIKTCCITGRCASCNGKCGALAKEFAVKNATNRDEQSIAYWQEHMFSAEGTDENTGEINVSKSAQAAVDRQVAEFRAEQALEIGYPSTYSKEKTAEVRYDERRTGTGGEAYTAGVSGVGDPKNAERNTRSASPRSGWGELSRGSRNRVIKTIEDYAVGNDEADIYLEMFVDGDISSTTVRKSAIAKMAEAFYTAMGGNRVLQSSPSKTPPTGTNRALPIGRSICSAWRGRMRTPAKSM